MKKFHTIPCLALAVALAAGGCASTQDGQLAQAQGTGLGALAGGLIGSAIGGRDGALTGALVGGGAGFLYGSHVANRKARYASTEAWLDACIEQANQVNQQAHARHRQLNQQLAALERRANRAIAANDRSEMRAVRSELNQVRSQMQSEVDTLDKQHGSFSQVLSDPDARRSGRVGGLRSAVGQIDNTRASYRGDLNRIAALNNRLDV